MVINPQSLLDEMDMLKKAGIDVSPQRLRISYAAHLITSAHQALDKALEAVRGKGNIGTTGRGIGPAYTDKATRRGLRVASMLEPDFIENLGAHIDEMNEQLNSLGAQPVNPLVVLNEFKTYSEAMQPYIADTSLEVCNAIDAGQRILAEGAQGTLLDIDHGTYPFVTSSSTVAAGVFTGLGIGIPAAKDAEVTGVCKSFQTRVGSGPFPTEVFDETAMRLRGTGENPWDEYGTTTGRARRVGWLDGVLLRYAVRVNGLTELIITKLDILSGLETVKLCVGYRRDGQTVADLHFGPSKLEGYEPVYEEFPGWAEDVSGIRKWSELPQAARAYLDAIAKLAGVPVRMVSVGPEREQMVENQ
jgi:adenylosuccinate synthase